MQRVFDAVTQVHHVPGAPGRRECERQHKHNRRQQHHQQRRGGTPEAQADMQPLEHRPGGEAKDCGPQNRRKERVQHEQAADREPTEQHPKKNAFGDRLPLEPGCAAETVPGFSRLPARF